jgi:hypothetical protein
LANLVNNASKFRQYNQSYYTRYWKQKGSLFLSIALGILFKNLKISKEEFESLPIVIEASGSIPIQNKNLSDLTQYYKTSMGFRIIQQSQRIQKFSQYCPQDIESVPMVSNVKNIMKLFPDSYSHPFL